MAAWERIPYFSYGHNTNIDEMKQRIPEAKILGPADLPNYRFEMQHTSTIRPSMDDVVHGVLWEIPVEKLDDLDWDEAYHQHYKHEVVTVLFHGKPYRALTYVMLKKYHSTRLPTRQYLDWIAQGYRDNGIPLSQLIDATEAALAKKKGR